MSKKIHKAGDHEVTKMRLLYEANNDMTHNLYFEVRFRVYCSPTRYFKGNYVVWFDSNDLAEEYPDKDTFSKKDVRDYAETIAYSFLDMAPTANITPERMRGFYGECRETISNFNSMLRAA